MNIYNYTMENQKPNRFENSKVYKIVCNVTGLIYVGSTTSELNVRLSKHKSAYKSYLAGIGNYITSFKTLENNDYDIHLIRSYEFDNNIDLLAKESFYIKKLNCVNKNIAGRTGAEYYLENKVELIAKQKIYADKNRAKLNAICLCQCGINYAFHHKSDHEKTKKHAKLMALINAIQIL